MAFDVRLLNGIDVLTAVVKGGSFVQTAEESAKETAMGTSVDMPLHEHGAMQAFMSFIGACEGAVFVDTDGTIR
jgi:hypothetical protein